MSDWIRLGNFSAEAYATCVGATTPAEACQCLLKAAKRYLTEAEQVLVWQAYTGLSGRAAAQRLGTSEAYVSWRRPAVMRLLHAYLWYDVYKAAVLRALRRANLPPVSRSLLPLLLARESQEEMGRSLGVTATCVGRHARQLVRRLATCEDPMLQDLLAVLRSGVLHKRYFVYDRKGGKR
jgi:hypothetical protein